MAQAVVFPCFRIRQAKAYKFILFTQGPSGVTDESVKYKKSVGRGTVGSQEPSNFISCTFLLSRFITLTKSPPVGAQAFSRPMDHSPPCSPKGITLYAVKPQRSTKLYGSSSGVKAVSLI